MIYLFNFLVELLVHSGFACRCLTTLLLFLILIVVATVNLVDGLFESGVALLLLRLQLLDIVLELDLVLVLCEQILLEYFSSSLEIWQDKKNITHCQE